MFHTISKLSPLISIISGTLLFVFGQYFLKNALDIKNDFVQTWIVFTFTMGFVAVVCSLILSSYNGANIITIENRDTFLYAACAGLVFAFGNLFWIYTISTKKSLDDIRVIMAGIETVLLFLLGIFLFSEKFTFNKFIGIIFILFGIYMIG